MQLSGSSGIWTTPSWKADPEDGAVLDALRAARKLPEQADYRVWRNKMLESYQSLEARESWWHLPDGRTLRVIANPHPQGGVTYIYENFTERLDLESRYNALTRVQGETLDNLSEAVAVFGSDGRLRLWNPAFGRIWKLEEEQLAELPHVNEAVLSACTLSETEEIRLGAACGQCHRTCSTTARTMSAAWSVTTATSSTMPPFPCPTADTCHLRRCDGQRECRARAA